MLVDHLTPAVPTLNFCCVRVLLSDRRPVFEGLWFDKALNFKALILPTHRPSNTWGSVAYLFLSDTAFNF